MPQKCLSLLVLFTNRIAVLASMQPLYAPVNELKMLLQMEEEFNRQLAASLSQKEMKMAK